MTTLTATSSGMPLSSGGLLGLMSVAGLLVSIPQLDFQTPLKHRMNFYSP